MASTRRRNAPRVFDARPDRLDLRDLPYRPPLKSLPPRFPDDRTVGERLPSYVDAGLILDQGREGACTGFGLACVANYLLWTRYLEGGAQGRFQRVSPRMLYEMAKRYDEWPGRDYDGSSCRGALKGWHKHGVCGETLWPYDLDAKGVPVFARPVGGWDADAATRPLGVYYRIDKDSVVDLQAAIVEIGAVYVSCGVHDGWDALVSRSPRRAPSSHDEVPSIPPPRPHSKVGGHAFALVGYNDRGFVVQNSWDTTWGAAGFGVLAYDDWVEHATDAWACALGVPQRVGTARGSARIAVASRYRVASGGSLLKGEEPVLEQAIDYPGYRPWSVAQAYEHSLLSGNDGELIVADVTRNREDLAGYAKDVAYDRPLQALSRMDKPRLVIYAHGGLVDEDASIRKIRVLGPCLEANGTYPLFLTWKTGAIETLTSLVQDWGREVFGGERPTGFADLVDAGTDRAMEVLARIGGRGVWREMLENAALGSRAGHNLDQLARNLTALASAVASNGHSLEVHLAGHSAGSVLLGHLLARLGADDLARAAPRIRTVNLLAPACSIRFALEHYGAAAEAGRLDLARVFLHVLSDANEKRDGLPTPDKAAYGKSLLYLVSRALEDVRKMPLLGLERAHDPAYARDTDQWAEGELESIKAWQAAWPRENLRVVSDPDVRVGRDGRREQATHGALDDDLDTMTRVIRQVTGKAPVAPLEVLG